MRTRPSTRPTQATALSRGVVQRGEERPTMNRFRRWPRVFVASLASVALLAVACGDDDQARGEAGEEGTATPRQGGRLVALMNTEVPGFDPTVAVAGAGSGPMQRMYAVFDALVYTESATDEVKPGIAESLTSDDGGATWTLTLREGVTFTDGTPYDAEAVKFNWDRHADPANGSQWLPVVESMTYEVVDPLTVRITLTSPDALFPWTVARSLSYIGSPTAIRERGERFNTEPVGAGPFVLESWTRDSEMVLARNPDYWHARRPHLDELVFRVVADDQQRLNAWRSGEGDLAFVFDPALSAQFRDAGAQMVSTEQGAAGLSFNLADPRFQDDRLRRAIELAVDREHLSEVTTQGTAEPVTTLFPEESPFYDPSITFPEHDLEAAQVLLDEYLADTGQTSVTFTFTTVNAGAAPESAELLEAQLDRLDGLEMEIELLGVEQMVPAMLSGEFESIVNAYREVVPGFLDVFQTDGARNITDYSNQVVDEAFAAARSTTDVDQQRAAFSAAARQIIRDVPFIATSRDSLEWAYGPQVAGVEMFQDGGLLSDRVGLAP